ncbi:MAG: Cof-type HAD-IIB family hydrolase [Clostridiales bacterium]|nr:Cof-type HAD-IIB family hydrolase [Clostridiales bacterium]
MGKCLFLDLDGTLLRDDKTLSPANYLAIRGALSRGHRAVITTGRPLKSALLQAQALDLTGPGCYVIAMNGGIVWDCAGGRELYRRSMAWDDLYALFDEANRRGVFLQTYDDRDVIVEARNDGETVRRYCAPIQMDYRVVDDVRRDLTVPPVKAMAIDFSHRAPVEELECWVHREMAGRLDCFFSCQYYLEIVPAGQNKGTAVEAMCARLGVPLRDAVAVGDAANDIPMLRAAGVGVAMANASPEVRSAADAVTLRDNNHDGVAEVVERFLG